MKVSQLALSALALGGLSTSLQAGAGILKGDTYVNTTNHANNFGSATLMNVGSGSTGLLQFDFSPAISGQVSNFPGAAVDTFIGKAILTVYVNKVINSGTLSVTPLMSAWSEATVTADTQPLAGGGTITAPVATAGQFVSIDITPIVQGWLTNNNNLSSPYFVGGGNFGIALTSTDGGSFVLDTKEATTTSHQAQLDIDVSSDYTGIMRKTMTLNTPGFANLMSIHLTGNNTAGGRIWYSIRATDGGGQLSSEEGVIQFQAHSNTITCTVETTDKLHLGLVNSGCTPGFFNPGVQPGISIFDNVQFNIPNPIVVHDVYFRIMNISGAVIRLEP
jgi:hypothetical protein